MSHKYLFLILLLLNSCTSPIQKWIVGREEEYAIIYYSVLFVIIGIVLSEEK